MSGLRDWSSPSAEEFEEGLDRATASLISMRSAGKFSGGSITGGLVELDMPENLAVISDLHGDFDCLASMLEEIDYSKFLLPKANKLVFLGDYVDRGDDSIGVLHSICKLESAYPENVVMMSGNHETPAEFPFSSHDYPFQLTDRFGESAGRALYRKSLLLFRELAVGSIIREKMLLVHGGLPTGEGLAAEAKKTLSGARQNQNTNRAFEEILWNDPREINSEFAWEESRRGAGRHFGQSITLDWLRATGTKCIVRGHEPVQGYRLDHGGRIMTLFSCRRPYPSFRAAYLLVDSERLAAVQDAADLVQSVRFPK